MAARRPQAAPAPYAALTASLASAAPQSATGPSSCPLAGSRTAKAAGASSQRPPTSPPRRTSPPGSAPLPLRTGTGTGATGGRSRRRRREAKEAARRGRRLAMAARLGTAPGEEPRSSGAG